MQSYFLQLIVSICGETIKYKKMDHSSLRYLHSNSAIFLINHLTKQSCGGGQSDQGWGGIVLTR